MKLYPSGLSGDLEQLSDDQLHLEGFLALRAFWKVFMETLKMRLSVALAEHVVARACKAEMGLSLTGVV